MAQTKTLSHSATFTHWTISLAHNDFCYALSSFCIFAVEGFTLIQRRWRQMSLTSMCIKSSWFDIYVSLWILLMNSNMYTHIAPLFKMWHILQAYLYLYLFFWNYYRLLWNYIIPYYLYYKICIFNAFWVTLFKKEEFP